MTKEKEDVPDDFESADEEGDGEVLEYDNQPMMPAQMYFPSAQGILRPENPELSSNVTLLNTDNGSKLYLIGTAHFSKESQEEVRKTVQTLKPDIVAVELCKSRISILQLDEETLLKEAQTMDFQKAHLAVKQSGLIQGMMQLMFLSMSARLTKELGMAPGGEFRVAVREASCVGGCRVDFCDRPIQITLRRALASLSWWQFMRIGWSILTSKESISKEDVERCKNRDLLEELLREMTGEYPALSHVFVKERDLYMARRLRDITKTVSSPVTGEVPSVVVAVVGIGHTPGIVEHWPTIASTDISDLMTVPKPSAVGVALKWTARAALLSTLAYAGYAAVRWTHRQLF